MTTDIAAIRARLLRWATLDEEFMRIVRGESPAVDFATLDAEYHAIRNVAPDDIRALLAAVEQLERERDEAVRVLDELAAWVGYGDWHYATVELACKVYAVLGERDYLPNYDCADAPPASDTQA
jgi:hypothetical protein